MLNVFFHSIGIITAAVIDGMRSHYKDLEAYVRERVKPTPAVTVKESKVEKSSVEAGQETSSHPLEDEMDEMQMQNRERRAKRMVELLELEKSRTGSDWAKSGGRADSTRKLANAGGGDFVRVGSTEFWTAYRIVSRAVLADLATLAGLLVAIIFLQVLVCLFVFWLLAGNGVVIVDEAMTEKIARRVFMEALSSGSVPGFGGIEDKGNSL
ncbi:hypothetical protein BC830DRAFT_1137423 [Chytriomyces sp. MP71]|nr:hypothetical protein BC830DRAFT_1137423 [Chytriomyces sp. MP71]